METLKQFQEEKIREYKELSESYSNYEHFLKQALFDQIKFIKENLPKEKTEPWADNPFRAVRDGFNICRKQVLNFLNK